MSETKPLKAVSISEIEEAIARAISGLTGTDANATIGSFIISTDSVADFNCQDTYKIDLSLRVGKSYCAESGAHPL